MQFITKKEKLIAEIQEKLNMDATEAKDRYDKQAYTAKDIKERYQMRTEYDRSSPEVQKTHLSPDEAQAKIRKYFTEEEVPVVFQEIITTPWGQEAYGKYHDGAITLVKNPRIDTPDHEALHAYFDMFTTKNRQKKVLEEVKSKQKITDDVEAEEWLADGFADFVAKRKTFT